MIINHNLSAMNALRQNKFNNVKLGKTMEKLSSGEKINRAADDAAGLAISEKMRAQIRGLNQAERNAADGISFLQTVEGYLGQTESILQRIRQLSVQTANGTLTQEDRIQTQVEVSQLVDEINRIASHAQFNNMNLLTGRFAEPTGDNNVTASMWVHIGANTDQRERLYIATMTAQSLGLQGTNGLAHTASFISLTTQESSNNAILTLDEAIKKVSKERANAGAYQNRLESASQSIAIGAENLTATESKIRDANMAQEALTLSKHTILNQSSQAMLAQARNLPQQVLQLLQ